MNALKIIGTATACGVVGAVVGAWVGFREGGDFNFAPVFTTPVGGLIGGAIGMVVGSVIFAH